MFWDTSSPQTLPTDIRLILYLLVCHYHLWTEAIRPALILLSGPRLGLGGFDLICSVSLLLVQASVMHKYFRNQNGLWHWTLFFTVGHAGSFVTTEREYYLGWRLGKEKGGREGDNKIHLHFKLIFMLECLLECVSLRSPSPTPILLSIVKTFALISFRDIYWRDPKIMSETKPIAFCNKTEATPPNNALVINGVSKSLNYSDVLPLFADVHPGLNVTEKEEFTRLEHFICLGISKCLLRKYCISWTC